jgi:mRNA-degrading endonuclease RelE of RelBE toxin-antitoxin system
MNQRRWRVVIASPAARDIDRLPMKVAAAALEAIQSIAADPRRMGKPLHLELTGQWSARRGPYRIIYSIDDSNDTITVIAVAHRADVYRRARRG